MSDLIKDSPGLSYNLRIFWRNRIRGWWLDHRWQIIGMLGIFALVLATVGFRI